jgi:cytochrome c553
MPLGQYADYFVLQLQLFKAQQRGGSDYAHIMRRVAAGLSLAQMRDVACYYASLTPGPLREKHRGFPRHSCHARYDINVA